MNQLVLLAGWWSGFQNFDLTAGLVLGAIIFGAAVIAIAGAILLPPIAIQAGATFLGTTSAVVGVSAVLGTVAFVVGGIHWGREGQLKRLEQIETIKRVSNQLDIYFEPSAGDTSRAADFECTLVRYDETNLTTEPTVTLRKSRIKSTSGEDFFSQIDQQIRQWFGKAVEADKDNLPRKVWIYMAPFPGDGVYERIKDLSEKNGLCIVNRIEGNWKSALE